MNKARLDLKLRCSYTGNLYAVVVLLAAGQGKSENFFSFEYGVQVFDLCADQICQLMENPEMDTGIVQIQENAF